MATPCSNNPNEVIEKVVSAKANADKFNTFVNGTDNQTVQLGSGIPTPTIRNVVRQVMADASWAKQFIADAPEGDLSLNNATAYGTQISRTLAERFGDVINVKDFGAKGDGATDDTASIQAAINSSHHANTGIRDIIFFPSGKYKVTTITISNGQSVILQNPTLISDSTAIEIDNAWASTIIEYANITAKDCGIWIKRGKSVHLEHIFVKMTHETENSDTVYGIRIGGVEDLYAGNENFISDCSIYSDNFVDSYGLYMQGDDNIVDGLIIYNFKYGIRDRGGANLYSNIHGWIDAEAASPVGSALFYLYKDVIIQNAYADSYQYAIFCTDSQGLFQHKIDGLKVYHGDSWPSDVDIYVLYNPGGYYKNSYQLSGVDVGSQSSAVQYFANFGSVHWPGYYNSNPYNADLLYAPYTDDTLYPDVLGSNANASRLVAVKNDRKTRIGCLAFNYFTSSNAGLLELELFSNSSFNDTKIQLYQTADGGRFSACNIIPMDTNTYNLGIAARVWNQLYCSTGPWTGSDFRIKDNISDPQESLFAAWSKVNFKVFQFKNAISKKGDSARLHTGLIAQEVDEAFKSEGLDASRYGLFCYDEWEDEYEDVEVIDSEAVLDSEGNEVSPAVTHIEHKKIREAGNIYGIRYEEALALECAYQRWLGEKRDARIAELEARLNENSGNGPAPSGASPDNL